MAQISLELAQAGHDVTINDISKNMLNKGRELAKQMSEDKDKQKFTNNFVNKNVNHNNWQDNMVWHCAPYQDLAHKLTGQYDLILCHALLEWLAEPKGVFDFFIRWLSDDGAVSVCFYNEASFVYCNLMMGNFNLLNNPAYQADNIKSLTPNHPVSKADFEAWVKQYGYTVAHISGLRVFYDYTVHQRGGLANPDAIIDMELKFFAQEPFKWMGRYLHYVLHL